MRREKSNSSFFHKKRTRLLQQFDEIQKFDIREIDVNVFISLNVKEKKKKTGKSFENSINPSKGELMVYWLDQRISITNESLERCSFPCPFSPGN